ncbi:hypothetical protein N0V88_002314 [Collariella sp. IMI 366227]|nr:hypothetical protein N0V88_002314 [Collariella sp. IMI 366227]
MASLLCLTAPARGQTPFAKGTKLLAQSALRGGEVLVVGALGDERADRAEDAWGFWGFARAVSEACVMRRFVAFDLYEDGQWFVSTMLGFLWLGEDALGFDPTVTLVDGKPSFEINRDGAKERIILEELPIAGKATTVWQGHPDGELDKTVVVKDFWQNPELRDEGDLLKMTTDQEVLHVIRTSHATFLTAMADCIAGLESLWKETGLFHNDISPINLMIDSGGRGFLIDLNTAAPQEEISVPETSTLPAGLLFKATGLLGGTEEQSFMHDLESCFWVIFWICIHHDSSALTWYDDTHFAEFQDWSSMDAETLGQAKLALVSDEIAFICLMESLFAPCFRPIIPCMFRL